MAFNRIFIACSIVSTVLVARAPAADPPAEAFAQISPYDPRILYVGRLSRRDPTGPRCEWAASSVTVRFRASGIRVKLDDTGGDDDDLDVIVDKER